MHFTVTLYISVLVLFLQLFLTNTTSFVLSTFACFIVPIVMLL